MITNVTVFEIIKRMSMKTLNPQHRVLLSDIASELGISKDKVLLLLIELEQVGVIKIHRTQIVSVSITNYGSTKGII